MEYQVLESRNLGGLIAIVNEYMQEGWEAQGGISVLVEDDRKCFLQAIIHEEDKNESLEKEDK